MRLGRLAADPIRLDIAPRHLFGAQLPPPTLDFRDKDFQPGLYGNDLYPNCTFVSLTNYMRGVAKCNGFALSVIDSDALTGYDEFLGRPPDLALTEGANMQDVLDYQADNKFQVGKNYWLGIPRVIELDRNSLASSLAAFKGGYWGVMLRERDMENNPVWDVVDGRDDGREVGGHAINARDYTGLSDENTVRIGTWGDWKPATWAWIADRLEEAHAVAWPQLKSAPI